MSSDHRGEAQRVPVVLVRTRDDEVVVVAGHAKGNGWMSAAAALAEKAIPILQALGMPEGSDISSRVFEMRGDDLRYWDKLQRMSSGDGFAYGTVLDRNGKFAKSLSFREISQLSNVTPPPFDPVGLATLAAVQQMQAQIEQLTDLVRDVKATVEEILRLVHSKQQAAVLSAFETISDISNGYDSDRAAGITDLDWSRLAPLEQVLKEEHRRIVDELLVIAEQLRFSTMEQAKEAVRISAGRTQDLIVLDGYVLRGLGRFCDLMVATKHARGELTVGDVEACRRLLTDFHSAAVDAINSILEADESPANRSMLKRLSERDGMFSGLWGGAVKDDQRRKKAIKKRQAVQSRVRTATAGWPEIGPGPGSQPLPT